MPLYIWNGGSPLVCPNIFGTEEVTNHDAITKKGGKIQTPGVPEGALFIWNGGSPLLCPYIFGTEEVL